MKWILCGDLHLTSYQPINRKDDILETSLNKLKSLLQVATDLKAPIFIAGDVFDRSRDWGILPGVIKLMRSYLTVDIYFVWGQHDLYMRNKQAGSIMGVLTHSGLVKELTADPIRIIKWKIYGCSWGDKIPIPLRRKGLKYALIIHAPIAQKELFPDQRFITDKAFIEQYSTYDLILCGDIHRRFVYRDKMRTLINCGPLLRLAADKYNLELTPAFCVFDTKSQDIAWYEVPAELGNVIFDIRQLEKKKERQTTLTEFIDSIKCNDAQQGKRITDRVRSWIAENRDHHSDVTDLLKKLCLGK